MNSDNTGLIIRKAFERYQRKAQEAGIIIGSDDYATFSIELNNMMMECKGESIGKVETNAYRIVETFLEFEKELVGSTTITIGDEIVQIGIYRNEDGNLEINGIGSVTSELLNNELVLYRWKENEQ